MFQKKKSGRLLPNWYIAYYDLNGKQIQGSSKSPIKSVAERMLRKKLEEVEHGVPVEQSRKLKYEDIRELLVLHYKNNNVGLITRTPAKSRKDKKDYVYGFDHLDPWFKNTAVRNINSPLLRKLQAHLLEKKLSNASCNRVMALLRRMMNLARKDGLIPAVPAFPMLKEENTRTGFVEVKQFKELLKHLPEYLHPLIVFLYTTGCRVGAALQITWDMVSPDTKTIALPGSITKNAEPIVLALTSDLTAALKKKFRTAGAPVFDATNLRKEWNKAKVAAKCPDLLIHDLRRSGARNLRKSGVPETVIMQIGGWKTRNVFIRYAIVATNDIENAMATLEENNGTLMEPAKSGGRK